MLFRKPTWVRLTIHAVLIVGAMAFALPFAWMLVTSFMVEKEVFAEAGINLLPQRPVPRTASPYINAAQWPEMAAPYGLADATWRTWAPRVRERLLARLAELDLVCPPGIDASIAQSECIKGVWDEIRRRIPTDRCREEDFTFVQALIASDVTGELAQAKLDAAHRALALGQVRLVRQHDRRQFNLTEALAPEQLAACWQVESGPVTLVPRRESGIAVVEAHYNLDRADAFTLAADFTVPPGTGRLPDDLQAIKLGLRHDETWHRLHVEIEMRGRRYRTVRPTYLGLDRWTELIVQPPGPEDDDPIRVKTWTVLEPLDHDPRYDHGPDRFRLRVLVTRSSHAQAWYGKATHNFVEAGRKVPFCRFTATSVVLVTLNIVLTLLSSSLVAYAFARLEWPGRDFLFVILLGTMMIPPQVTMIPGFVIIKSLGWYNTLTPLWAFAAFGSAFSIFLLRQFMKTIPRDLEEAARIDGCGFLRVWWHVMLPLVKPTLAAIAIFTFMASWNDFMGPLIYVNDPRLYPLALGLFSLHAIFPPQPMPVLMAAAVMMTLPIIAIFFLAQKYFIQGVTLTGMKG